MSEWYEVKDADNIVLSDDKFFVEILFDTNYNGNRYVEVPVDMLVKIFGVCPNCHDKLFCAMCGKAVDP